MSIYNKGPLDVNKIFPSGQQSNTFSNFGEKVSQGYGGLRGAYTSALEASVAYNIGKGIWGGVRRYAPQMIEMAEMAL